MKKGKRILSWIIAIVCTLCSCFLLYTMDYSHTIDTVKKEIQADDRLVNGSSYMGKIQNGSSIGIILYPGAKVEYDAYYPLMNGLYEAGYSSFIVEMPFNLAIFGIDRANEIIEKYPDIHHWYIAGHSLGGAMASSYYAKHLNEIDGLILLGSYPSSEVPLDSTLTIYGSRDLVLNKDKIQYTKNVYVIDGGNHAQFGNYGTQKGDGEASIDASSQQATTIQLMDQFIQE